MANSNPSHKITLQKAKQMTKLYRDQREQILKPEFSGKDILPISETMGREAIDRLLAQPDCVAVRMYYGMDEQMRVKLVLVGVNSRNEDILKVSSGSTLTAKTTTLSTTEESSDDTEGEILDESQRCPPNCPLPSEL